MAESNGRNMVTMDTRADEDARPIPAAMTYLDHTVERLEQVETLLRERLAYALRPSDPEAVEADRNAVRAITVKPSPIVENLQDIRARIDVVCDRLGQLADRAET